MKNECANNDDLQVLSVDDMRKIDGGNKVIMLPTGAVIIIRINE
jgi:hypothetical protein